MTQTYRTTDGARWGSGKGSNLTPAEVDINFWDVIQRVVTLEALPSAAAGIDHFSISGTQFYVVMTDATTLGPYTLPVATFNARGEWAPSTAYAVMDTFTINGKLYVVMFSHTSGLTFDAGANDGLGHDYYSLMIETPGSSLPTGGATGQVLQKSSSTNYATTWGWKFPVGGTARKYLIQVNSTQDNAAWGTPTASDIDFVPVTGSVLTSDNVAEAIEEVLTSIHAADVSFTPSTGSHLTSTNVADALDELGAGGGGGGGGGGALTDLSDVVMNTGDPSSGGLLYYDNSLGMWTASNLISSSRTGQQMFWDATSFTWKATGSATLGTTGTVALSPGDGPVFMIRPSGNVTLQVNSVNSPNMIITLIVLTSGTSSFNVTFFSSQFKSQGVLATGTVDQKYFVVQFVCCELTGYWVEISRTIAM